MEQHAANSEVLWRIHNHWLFDANDKPSVGQDNSDEKDRTLVDKFHPKYVFSLLILFTLLILCSGICSKECLSTKKTTINGLLQTPQSIRLHLTAAYWGFYLI